MSNEFAYGDSLVQSVVSLSKGDLTEIIKTRDAHAILAYIAERAPGDAETSEGLKPQVHSAMVRYRLPALYEEWGNYLLAQADFKELIPTVSETEEQEQSTTEPATGDKTDDERDSPRKDRDSD